MDISNLLRMGAELFINSNKSGDAGSGLDIGGLTSALSGLLGGGSSGGSFDPSTLLSKMDSAGLGTIAQSWLGDGSNTQISSDQVTKLLGPDKISEFASKLGVTKEEAAGGLSDALPNMIDKASSGGSLLDSIGGVSGAMGLAGKLFGK
jgi:uncharacterized protein YidB (DUF937 family)